MSLYKVAGVSKHNDQVKVRFCSDRVLRIKNLQKQGDTDIQLVDLPQPMDKWHACEYLLNSGQFTDYVFDIVEVQGKKITKARSLNAFIPKVEKTLLKHTLQKTSNPKVEVGAEIDSIKELALS